MYFVHWCLEILDKDRHMELIFVFYSRNADTYDFALEKQSTTYFGSIFPTILISLVDGMIIGKHFLFGNIHLGWSFLQIFVYIRRL